MPVSLLVASSAATVLLVILIGEGVVGGMLADRKGYPIWGGVATALVFSLLGILILLLIPKKEQEAPNVSGPALASARWCPSCGTQREPYARFCAGCGQAFIEGFRH